MAARKIKISEKAIETSIIQWLKWKGIFAFKVENGGVYDERRGRYRFNSVTRMRGVADIIGIFRGRPMAIEVKSESGRLSEHQESFLEEFEKQGGLAIVARSVEEVEEALK